MGRTPAPPYPRRHIGATTSPPPSFAPPKEVFVLSGTCSQCGGPKRTPEKCDYCGSRFGTGYAVSTSEGDRLPRIMISDPMEDIHRRIHELRQAASPSLLVCAPPFVMEKK